MPDDESRFTKYPIQAYKYWTVYLHQNQAYLGRCKIALNRLGQLDPFLSTTRAEQDELKVIIDALQGALKRLYQPDLLNYANMRNTWHRCHWHVIPRYQTPRTLEGKTFVDNNWGKNYAPYDRDFIVPPTLMAKIQTDIRVKLEGSLPI